MPSLDVLVASSQPISEESIHFIFHWQTLVQLFEFLFSRASRVQHSYSYDCAVLMWTFPKHYQRESKFTWVTAQEAKVFHLSCGVSVNHAW
jgi:hypothetical protein